MILVIGAGITGLTLSACINGDVMIVEADDAIGGYCRTTKRNGFVWDRAGHFFHFRDSGIKDFFQREIPSDRFVKVAKKSAIYFEEYGFVDFPFQKNIHQLPQKLYIQCLTDVYLATRSNAEYSTFKEFVYATMGEGISDLFLIPYNQKLYACDLDELDRDAMGRFFPQASFEDILLNARYEDNNSYNADFSYPKDGAEEFVNILSRYALNHAQLKLNTSVISVDLERKEALLSSGEKVVYDVLVNTAPLNKFCELAGIDTRNANLSANKVAVFNLGFDRKSSHEMHWVYFPENEVFYRVGSYHNILSTDRASIYVEIGLPPGGLVNEKELLDKVLVDLKKAGIVDEVMRLVDHEFFVMDPAYVHINSVGEKFKLDLMSNLSQGQAYSVGRYGGWTYCSIEDNMIEARDLARKIVLSAKSEQNSASEFVDLFQNAVT